MVRSPARLLLLFAAGLSLGCALLLWQGAETPAPELTALDAWHDDEPEAPVPVAVDDAAAAMPGAEAAEASAGSDRTEVPFAATGVSSGPGPSVIVLAGRPPQPVAGAAVAFIDRGSAQRLRARRNQPICEWDLPAVFGATLRTDAGGRVQLPALVDATLCSAAHEQQFAFTTLRPDQQGEVRLLLQPDETLRILVQDGDGQPAPALPVAVYQGSRFEQGRRLWAGTTARSGCAEVVHFQLLRGPPKGGNRFCAVVPLPLSEPVAAMFEGRPVGTEPVVLQLPSVTSLAVTLVDAQKVPLLHPATIQLAALRDPKWSVDLPVDRAFDSLRLDKPVGAAPVRFLPLGRSLPLRPTVQLADDRRDWPAPDFTTAAGGGGETLQIRLPDDYAVLAGRGLDDTGRALARQARAELSLQQVPFWRSGLYACADGRFDLPVRMRGPLPGPVLTVRCDAEGEGGQVLGARVELPPLRPGQRVELGDLQLSPLPPLCRGEVVNDIGEPVPNATVSMQTFGLRKGKPDWFDAALSRAHTDEQGQFTVIDSVPVGLWRLAAQAPDHVPAISPDLPQATGLRLLLLRLGTVRGSIRVPRWLPPAAVSLQFQRLTEPAGQPTTVALERRDGAFVVRNLTPGPYLVRLRLRHLPEPILSIDGLLVQPGRQRDARLDNLDLDNLVFRYLLHATGPDGRLMALLDAPILARYDGPDARPRQVGFRWQKGNAELITDSPLINLTLFGQGLMPRTVVLAPGEHNIYLQPLFPAVIRLPGARLLCGPERKVRVSMVCTEDTGFPQSLAGVDARSGQQFAFNRWELGNSGGAWLGDSDVVEVPLSKNGKYEVVLRLYGDGDRGQVSVRVGATEVVLDGPRPVERSLALDGSKIEAAIARLLQTDRSRGRGNRAGR